MSTTPRPETEAGRVMLDALLTLDAVSGEAERAPIEWHVPILAIEAEARALPLLDAGLDRILRDFGRHDEETGDWYATVAGDYIVRAVADIAKALGYELPSDGRWTREQLERHDLTVSRAQGDSATSALLRADVLAEVLAAFEAQYPEQPRLTDVVANQSVIHRRIVMGVLDRLDGRALLADVPDADEAGTFRNLGTSFTHPQQFDADEGAGS